MAWNNQGPWGSGSGDGRKSPWERSSPEQRPSRGSGPEKLQQFFSGGEGRRKVIVAIVAALLLIWLGSGFYRVNPGEQGVALVFGKIQQLTGPGLNWNWPAPIGRVMTPDIAARYRVEVGFRSASAGAAAHDETEESLMLTGDENIIDVQFVVLWKIRDVRDYLFAIRDPESSVRNAVEAAMREIIGQSTFELARTQGRGQIETNAQELAQKILDSYHAGIAIEQVSMQKVDPPQEVIEAFRDVQAARADKERMANEAQAYFNQITQGAEGQAAQLIKQAEAYRQEKLAVAQGDTQRFLAIYAQYRQHPDLTKRRLYLETMEQVYKDTNKVIVDGPGGALPLLPLADFFKKAAPASQNEQQQ